MDTTIADISTEGLFVKEGRAELFLPYTDLLWAEAEGNYIILNSTQNRNRMIRSTLINLKDRLPCDHFIRVHKTYIVNIPSVTGITGNSLFIGQKKIPIGRIYKKEIEKYFVGLRKNKVNNSYIENPVQ